MKTCEKCRVTVAGDKVNCPLCQNELTTSETRVESGYPLLVEHISKRQMILKIATFVAVIGSFVAIFLNRMLSPDSWWSFIIAGTLGCLWISIVLALHDYKNILKYLLYQSVIIIGFSLFLDRTMGWQGWSLTYVIPAVLTLAMIVMYILSKALKLDPGDYMIYLLLDAIFGIIPMLFIWLEWIEVQWPTLVCIIGSVVSVTALIIFEGRNMYSELKRRLHV